MMTNANPVDAAIAAYLAGDISGVQAAYAARMALLADVLGSDAPDYDPDGPTIATPAIVA